MLFRFCNINHGKFSIREIMKHQSLIKMTIKWQHGNADMTYPSQFEQWQKQKPLSFSPYLKRLPFQCVLPVKLTIAVKHFHTERTKLSFLFRSRTLCFLSSLLFCRSVTWLKLGQFSTMSLKSEHDVYMHIQNKGQAERFHVSVKCVQLGNRSSTTYGWGGGRFKSSLMVIECVNHITAAKQQPFRVHENHTAAYHFD